MKILLVSLLLLSSLSSYALDVERVVVATEKLDDLSHFSTKDGSINQVWAGVLLLNGSYLRESPHAEVIHFKNSKDFDELKKILKEEISQEHPVEITIQDGKVKGVRIL